MLLRCGVVAYVFSRAAMALCLLGFAVFAQAQTSSKTAEIEFAYVEQPPRTFTNAEGKADGQVIRLMNDVFGKAGIAWRAVPYPAARLFENLKDGTSQVSILVRVPALENACLWSKSDFGGEDIRVYSIGNKPAIKSREDLIGKNVIALRGYSYGGLVSFLTDEKNNINLSLASSNDVSFEMLAAGRADYLVQYGEASDRVLAAKPVADARFTVIGRINRYLVISKAYPEAEKTMARLEEILKGINVAEYLKAPQK
jgi:ABC-type amino acid transport substrate-binding protein